MAKYNHKKIEAKWQKYWQAKKTFVAKDFSKKPKKFVLVEFPYPSGEGLHMGHLRPYVAADVYARFNRMQGKEVIFPMGWDAFGLPAENFAIKKGVHPSVSTKKNVANAKRQIQSWGLSFDWSREVNTTDPNYYKWTQWIFLQFYKKGLAFEATGLINWCPKDKTGLANEEVIDGKCERCGSVVEKKELRQWYLRITAYAEKLLEGLKNLPQWPEPVKLQQENWIGKSTGAEIDFELAEKSNYVLLHGFNGTPDGVFFPWLKQELDKRGLKHQAPQMPNPENPTEEEQVSFVLKNCKFDENTILFGHSLGCVVAMKVLEKLDKKIGGLVLAGGFSSPQFKDKVRPFHNTFNWEFNYEKIKNSVGFIKILSDPTDFAVRIEQGKNLHKNLGGEFFESPGAEPHFTHSEEPSVLRALIPSIKVFTTRLDTIFSGTFIVLAPEHALVPLITSDNKKKEVETYIAKTKKMTDQQRQAADLEKTGVFTGAYAINPATGDKVPVWVSDFVIGSYGFGAVFADAHDERDFEIAKKFNIPLKVSIRPKDDTLWEKVKNLDVCYGEEGVLVNSGQFDGLTSAEARAKILEWLESKGVAKRKISYKLRDWVFSRQRYWGEPIPIIHCPKCGIVPVPEKDLPVKLPNVKKYEPTGTGESPLAAIDKWVNVKCPVCKTSAKRETNTMPQWAGSSWYWLRYTDPKNKKEFASLKKQKYWTPVDVYFGGMEHTTLHLLYSRFWNLFLHDQGLVTQSEPYTMRKPHGLILGPDGEKMSKSRGNVVNPDTIVKSHGADTLRMYELFLGPHEATVSWNELGHVGVKRFLDRVWGWVNDASKSDGPEVKPALHKLIKKITEDIENYHFNTAISSFMEFYKDTKAYSKETKKVFTRLLYPFAPHLAEELNQILGGKKSLQLETWPSYDPSLAIDQTVEIVVQINGKVRSKLNIKRDLGEEEVKKLALTSVGQNINPEAIKRVIFVPNRLINLVV